MRITVTKDDENVHLHPFIKCYRKSLPNACRPRRVEQTRSISQRTTARKDTVSEKGKKTIAEKDEELRLKLEGISGDGGASGVEYEGGKAEGLKRGVKENMFRVI
ncbi:hypothetical protein CCUS01_08852 [Colletotrichum cuscutae]|uniref:Uncharacterized protein n=1 Tax=Colletotrichum cuscutae TaxID=1209917 RepID=A0AAI9UP03_9PEZI|nr:hypothetical protein CCUS01_08852 [Colletotrichum cuscutae]